MQSQNKDRFTQQDDQYTFPYHHVPHFDAQGCPRITRTLGWGIEYLCYMGHVVDIVRRLEPDSILDVGCGDGRLLAMVPQVRRRKGIDLSKRAISFAKAFSDADFDTCDVSEIEEEFDVVSLIEVLEHVHDDDAAEFLRIAAERTNRNGKLIISVPSNARPVHRKHYRHYDVKTLKSFLIDTLPDFEIQSIEHIFNVSKTHSLILRAIQNRLWHIEIPLLTKAIWTSAWRNRVASHERGAHIIAVCSRLES